MESPAKRRGRPISPSAAYRGIADRIRRLMLKGVWPPGTVIPSIRQLAAEFRTGERTVRLAVATLKQEDRIRATVRRRLEVKQPGGAITTTSGVILEVMGGNLHTFLQSANVAAIQRGIEFGAGDLWAPILIVHDEHFRAALPPELLDYPLRGIALYGQFQDQMLRRYQRMNLPVVLVDRPGTRWNLHAVAVENESAARDATRRLIQLGHRRLAFLRFVQLGLRDVDVDSKERQAGFVSACDEAGIKAKDRMILNSFPNDTPDSKLFNSLLDARPHVTAVLCCDPDRARLVIDAVRRRNRRIPHDMSVVTFQSDPPELPEISGPRTDFLNLGRQAVRLLLEPRRPPMHVRISANWFDGHSVSPPP